MALFELYKNMLTEHGVELDGATILDWGCGSGALVAEGRAAGYNVIGCDFRAHGEHLSPISEKPYRLPYSDRSIDVVISCEVLEHVMDYDGSLAEVRRVLKPGGAFLHMFPARWMPIEPHVFVPGATVIRARPWLALWAFLGVRNGFQGGMSALERCRHNRAFLLSQTNYMPRRAIARHFGRHFGETHFIEDTFLRCHRPSWRRIPFAAALYRTFRGKVVFGRAR